LRNRGYYVFDSCLPADVCDRLLQFALTQPCKMRRMDGGKPGSVVKKLYSREAPEAIRYDFEPQDLLRNHDVQKLLADLSFVALAQEYLGARPSADILNMWWHTSFAHGPDSEAGQFFHFDMDRPKWLKIFIYLTDVTPQSGPHAFVAGSQRTDGIPESLLRRGYVRISDDDVTSRYTSADILELTAPRGSIIVEDTRGLHKGKHVEHGDRLMLQIQFSNSLFGAAEVKSRLGNDLCAELRQRAEQYRGLYSAYL
jgi:phytanoyl-CoA dioxygenase PhyH